MALHGSGALSGRQVLWAGQLAWGSSTTARRSTSPDALVGKLLCERAQGRPGRMRARIASYWCLLAVALGACQREPTPSGSNSPQGNSSSEPTTSATELARSDLAPPSSEATPSAIREQPVVDLDGSTRAHAVTLVDGAASRVYSRSLRTWIYAEPSKSSPRLGYLRTGGSAPINGRAVSGRGCATEWQPIKPRGYICMDGRATLDATDPIVELTREHPPDFSRKLPYIYGTVRNPGPVFGALPSREQLRDAESGVEERMPEWLQAPGEIGASYAQEVWLGPGQSLVEPAVAWQQKLTQDVPELLRAGTRLPGLSGRIRDGSSLVIDTMRPRVGYAFVNTFLWEGRRYGLSTSMELLPTDRLRPIQGSDRHGYRIGKDVDFPFALVRSPIAKFRGGESAPYWAALPLTGKQQFFDEVLHYETTDGKWISDRVASRMDPARKMPGWGKRGEKWIDINITKQTLMLYEGEVPVYATLVSTGEAGLEDHESSTATKRGIFRIHTKHVSSTMSSRELGEEFELREVPYVMYFDKEGYALHGAYWHDKFGIPKSHGCINLTPEDARRVFHWTTPQVPVGWHAALLPLTGTVVFIHP